MCLLSLMFCCWEPFWAGWNVGTSTVYGEIISLLGTLIQTKEKGTLNIKPASLWPVSVSHGVLFVSLASLFSLDMSNCYAIFKTFLRFFPSYLVMVICYSPASSQLLYVSYQCHCGWPRRDRSRFLFVEPTCLLDNNE